MVGCDNWSFLQSGQYQIVVLYQDVSTLNETTEDFSCWSSPLLLCAAKNRFLHDFKVSSMQLMVVISQVGHG